MDINDLTVVLAHYGQTGQAWAQGEFTGDGTVDINDLTIVLAHYGQSTASADARSAVPEPAGLLMVAAMFLAVAGIAVRRGGVRSRKAATSGAAEKGRASRTPMRVRDARAHYCGEHRGTGKPVGRIADPSYSVAHSCGKHGRAISCRPNNRNAWRTES